KSAALTARRLECVSDTAAGCWLGGREIPGPRQAPGVACRPVFFPSQAARSIHSWPGAVNKYNTIYWACPFVCSNRAGTLRFYLRQAPCRFVARKGGRARRSGGPSSARVARLTEGGAKAVRGGGFSSNASGIFGRKREGARTLRETRNGHADTLVRATAADGRIRCMAAVTTDTVAEAARRHRTSHTVSAALGRTLTGALLLGAGQKEF